MDKLNICPNCLQYRCIDQFTSNVCDDCFPFKFKTCRVCQQTKSFNKFSYDKTKKGYRSSICKKCNTARLQQIRKERTKGLSCCRCEGKLLKHSKIFCESCWYRVQSCKLYHTEKHWKDLQLLLKQQNFLCPRTGITLIPCHNMKIYYRIEGGSNHIDNLYWSVKNL